MNKQILSNRWFIWTTVAIIIAGVAVWSYVQYATMKGNPTENISSKPKISRNIPFMGPITVKVINPLNQKPIPNLEVDYLYDIELAPIPAAMTSPPHKTLLTKYSTDENGKFTILQTAITPSTVTPHFYRADIVINPNDKTHNNNFAQFDIHLPTMVSYSTHFPDSTVLRVTTNAQNVTIELVPLLAHAAACRTIATKNIKQCCILRAQVHPRQNCESLDYWFGDGDTFIRQK